MAKTVYHILRESFGFQGKETRWLDTPAPSLVDWKKAREIYGNMPATTLTSLNALWECFLQVGFEKEKIVSLVDPPIREVVRRILDLPILTLASCSGHPDDPHPYLVMMFRERSFGYRFLLTCKYHFTRAGISMGLLGNTAWVFGTFGPVIPVKECVSFALPITFDWQVRSVEECQRIWRIFSGKVLHHFDARGEYIPELSRFHEKTNPVPLEFE